MRVLRTKGLRVGVGVVFVAVLLASGCGSSSKDASSSTASTTPQDVVIAPDGPPQTGGTLTYGLASESDGWNPTEGRWATDGTQVGMAIFDPLAAYNADGDWAPYLAQSFTPNADFTEWTIKLRPDVKFQNGTVFDSAAVVKTINAHRQSALTKPTFANISDLEATDPADGDGEDERPVGGLPRGPHRPGRCDARARAARRPERQ